MAPKSKIQLGAGVSVKQNALNGRLKCVLLPTTRNEVDGISET